MRFTSRGALIFVKRSWWISGRDAEQIFSSEQPECSRSEHDEKSQELDSCWIVCSGGKQVRSLLCTLPNQEQTKEHSKAVLEKKADWYLSIP